MDSCQTNHFTFDAINLSQRSLFRLIEQYEVCVSVARSAYAYGAYEIFWSSLGFHVCTEGK